MSKNAGYAALLRREVRGNAVDVWKTDPEWFGPWFNTKAYHVLYGHRSEFGQPMRCQR